VEKASSGAGQRNLPHVEMLPPQQFLKKEVDERLKTTTCKLRSRRYLNHLMQ